MDEPHDTPLPLDRRVWRRSRAESVAGSALRPGDRVLLDAVVTEINEHGHAIVAAPDLGGPWHLGDHFMWAIADDDTVVVRARPAG